MIEFSAKDAYNIRRTLEDADFHHFVKLLAGGRIIMPRQKVLFRKTAL